MTFLFTFSIENGKIVVAKIMKDNKIIDYSSLTKEELISLIMKSKKETESISLKLDSVTKERDEFKKLYDEMKAKYQKEVELVKKANIERFVTNSDNVCLTAQERKAYSRKKLPSAEDSQSGEKARPKRTYTIQDLAALAEGNSVVLNDNLSQLRAEHPDWDFVKIGEDVSYIIERVKAHIVVHKVVTPKYKAKQDRNHIYQALSSAPISHSYIGPGLLADMCTAKFQFGMPVYRYYLWLKGCGFEIPMRTIYGCLMKAAKVLEPICGEIEDVIREGKQKCIGIDETYLKVVDEIGDEREHCYVYVLQCESEGRKIRFFHYTGSRSSEYVKKLLIGYGGAVLVDGYSGYDSMPEGIKKQRCMCHLRRKFADIAKTVPDGKKKDSIACQIVRKIDRIFALEKSIMERKLSPVDVLAERNSPEYLAEVDAFREYISSVTYAKDSSLGDAIRYYLNGGDDFFTFLECGDIPIHNNSTERCCKSFAANRRGFLFCKSVEGAKAASMLTTVIKTAEANGLYPDEYLAHVFSHFSDGNKKDLLPWSEEIRNNPKIRIDKK